MRILLVQAAWSTDDWAAIPTMPLGLISLVAVLREEFGDEVTCSLLDLSLRRSDPTQELRQALLSFQPDVVGMRGLTHQHAGIVAFCRQTRELLPQARIVVGGPHASTAPEMLLAEESIDCVVPGEGEETFRELVGAWLRGEDATAVKGTAWRGEDGVRFAPPRPPLRDLDQLPLPAYDLLDFPAYHARPTMTMYKAEAYANIFTSRGCPYGCSYCHRIFGKQVRLRSVPSLMEEISFLMDEYGISELHIIDDIFNIKKRRVLEFAEAIGKLSRPLRLAFPNGLRADLMDQEVVRALGSAGTFFVRYAIETACPERQKLIGKNLDLERAYEAIEMTAEQGIFVGIFNMLGFMGESAEEMRRTVERACQTSAIFAHFFRVTAYPGTQLWKEAAEAGLLSVSSTDKLDALSFKTQEDVGLSPVPAEEIADIRRAAIRSFSFSRKRVDLYRQAVPTLFSAADRADYIERKLKESEIQLDEIEDASLRESLAEMVSGSS